MKIYNQSNSPQPQMSPRSMVEKLKQLPQNQLRIPKSQAEIDNERESEQKNSVERLVRKRLPVFHKKKVKKQIQPATPSEVMNITDQENMKPESSVLEEESFSVFPPLDDSRPVIIDESDEFSDYDDPSDSISRNNIFDSE